VDNGGVEIEEISDDAVDAAIPAARRPIETVASEQTASQPRAGSMHWREFSVCVTVTVRIPLLPQFVDADTATGQFVVERDRYIDG
jgi:hypothetical protein